MTPCERTYAVTRTLLYAEHLVQGLREETAEQPEGMRPALLFAKLLTDELDYLRAAFPEDAAWVDAQNPLTALVRILPGWQHPS